jgi:hypothetical protein
VANIYPADTELEYARLLFGQSPPKDPAASLAATKAGLLKIWEGVLSKDEVSRIKEAASPRDLLSPMKGTYWPMPRRVRLDVAENFQGAADEHFEVFTGSGGGDCSVGFRNGESYLVVAYKDESTGR